MAACLLSTLGFISVPKLLKHFLFPQISPNKAITENYCAEIPDGLNWLRMLKCNFLNITYLMSNYQVLLRMLTTRLFKDALFPDTPQDRRIPSQTWLSLRWTTRCCTEARRSRIIAKRGEISYSSPLEEPQGFKYRPITGRNSRGQYKLFHMQTASGQCAQNSRNKMLFLIVK